ncbi:MAG TPA: ADP-ribosylglycohydrolase family protein [Chitinophagales bacterium]|nr:ADP-ribosylglycohydrolase family protein [Chitinophagales bacterium]
MSEIKSQMEGVLYGIAIGDALGVPVEFISRNELKKNPVTEMKGGGTHHQPAGTWSDDTALSLCLAECIAAGFDLDDLARRFINWQNFGYMTALGETFDIGMTTQSAISNLESGIKPALSGDDSERSNGNGSLMRILPLIFLIKNYSIEDRFDAVRMVSSITHAHMRSVACCFIYIEYALRLMNGENKFSAFEELRNAIPNWLQSKVKDAEELKFFGRIFSEQFHTISENEILSSGYALHTLEASLWCFLNSDDYESCVLKAVNLGDDTDTTGAVAGGLAGLYYGISGIPDKWIEKLSGKNLIDEVISHLHNSMEQETHPPK